MIFASQQILTYSFLRVSAGPKYQPPTNRIKSCCFRLAPSFLSHSQWGKLAAIMKCRARTCLTLVPGPGSGPGVGEDTPAALCRGSDPDVEDPQDEQLKPPPIAPWVIHLRSRSSSPAPSMRWLQPWPTVDCNLRRESEPQLRHSWIPDP